MSLLDLPKKYFQLYCPIVFILLYHLGLKGEVPENLLKMLNYF